MPSERQHVTDWEHVFFLTAMLGFLVWYLADATAASPTFSNLILIAPVGAAALILLLYVGAVEIFGHGGVPKTSASGQSELPAESASSRFRSGSIKAILLLMGLFAIFVAAIPYLGFDVASFFFIAGTLWLLGERRVLMTLAIALGFRRHLLAALTLLTVPVPLGVAPFFGAPYDRLERVAVGLSYSRQLL